MLALVVGVALGWVRLYTRGLAEETRDRRITELASDLWEHERDAGDHDATDASRALAIVGRTLRGIPADLSWRLERRTGLLSRRWPAHPLLRRQAVLALLGAALAAASVAGAARLVLSDRRIVVGANTLVGRGGSTVDATNSPTVAVNPSNPSNLVITRRIDRPGYGAALDWSFDGGRSWGSTSLPLPETVPACAAPLRRAAACPYAPEAAFARDGTLYVSFLHLARRGNRPEGLWLARSTDGGRTLSRPVRVAAGVLLQPRLAVGRDGTVIVTFMQPKEVALFRVDLPTAIFAVRSTDGGRTFSAPVRVSDSQRIRVGAATPVVEESGTLVVLYEDFRDDVRDYGNLEGPAWEGNFALVVSGSTDGGRTFSRGIEVEPQVVPARRFLVFLPEFPSLASGPDGTAYAAWADARYGDEDVFLRRSTDGGVTWGGVTRVNDNPMRDGTSQYLPNVSMAPSGRVDLLFLDRRRDPSNVMTDAELAVSYDRGGSFENQRLSSRPFSSSIGPAAGPQYLPPDFGSRLGLASLPGKAIAAWTDTRRGTGASGRQDVVVASVQVPNPAQAVGGGVLVALLLAAAAGLLLAARRPATAPMPSS